MASNQRNIGQIVLKHAQHVWDSLHIDVEIAEHVYSHGEAGSDIQRSFLWLA